jgi:uncharacterized protein YbjT (DUF2867 family)
VFFSIYDCDRHPTVPLMQIKTCTEEFLKDSGLNYTVFRLCGYMQVRDCSLSATLHAAQLGEQTPPPPPSPSVPSWSLYSCPLVTFLLIFYVFTLLR